MDFKDYQQAAMDFLDPELRMDWPKAMDLGALGISGESGEITDAWKKVAYHHHPMDKEHFKRELGDVLWYIALISETLGFTIEDVAETNINKLKTRYPNGWDPNCSIHRSNNDN